MSEPKHIGCVFDTTGYEADIWFSPAEHHIFLYVDTNQIGDFPVGEPCQKDPQQVAGAFVYSEWLKTGASQKVLIVTDDPDAVIEDIYGHVFPIHFQH